MGRFRQAFRERVKRNRRKISRKSVRKATSTRGIISRLIGRARMRRR